MSVRFAVLKGLAFVIVMSMPSTSLAASAARAKLWAPGDRLNVCFFGGNPQARSAVTKIARAWSGPSSITLDFGPEPSYRLCSPSERSHVRVGFLDAGSWSFLGTDSVNIVSQDEPSLNIPLNRLQSDGFADLVLRSFGHALGLRSDFFADPKCIKEVNMAAIDVAVRGEFEFDKALSPVTAFAKVSALNPPLSPSLFTSGDASTCYVEPSSSLTAEDIAALRAVYQTSGSVSGTPTRAASARSLANTHFEVDSMFLDAAWAWDDRALTGPESDRLQAIHNLLEGAVKRLRLSPPTDEIRDVIAEHDAQRWAEARKLALSAGQKEQGAAFLILAYLNLRNVGSPRNPMEAAKWIRAAAQRNDPYGHFLLGLCYEWGIGLVQNLRQAMSSYANAGAVPLASERLARLHLSETGAGKNRPRAIELYRTAAAAGLSASKRSLAFLLDQGMEGPTARTDALALAEQAAQAGDAPAMLLSALLYFDAVTPDSSTQRGIKALDEAARKEFGLARAVLGLLYEFGWVDSKSDLKRAIELYKEAATAEMPNVQRHLAELLATGSAADRKEMIALLQSAAHQGDLRAQLMLSDLFRSGLQSPGEEELLLKADPAASTLWRLIASIYAPSVQRKKILEETSALVSALNPREWVGAHEPAVVWVRRRERLDRIASAPDRGARLDTPELSVKRQGSGVIISREGHVLTNDHVVNGCAKVGARLGETARELKMSPPRRDPHLDLAIGKLEWLPDASAVLREEVPANNPPVFVAGYPDTASLGEQEEVWPGHISGYQGMDGNTARFRVTPTSNPGKSGGGIFDAAGNLVGISVSRVNDGGLQNINIAIKADSIASALRSWNVAYDKADPAAAPLAPGVVPSLARQRTVLVTCYE